MSVKEIDGSDNFKKQVLESKKPVLVDLWATWCGPCRWYSPIIEELSGKYEGKLDFVKVDVDKNNEIASKYGVEAIPTTLLIENGNVKASAVGAMQKDALKKWIDENL
ncbi:thioredoxin [Candidatus Parvarchaeota archaeon]|nr:thioredoxin [Candidatus Parvarchaeota archaeon]